MWSLLILPPLSLPSPPSVPSLTTPSFLKCDPAFSPGGSGIGSDPSLIDQEFQKEWLPCFSRSTTGNADLQDFRGEVQGWLLVLDGEIYRLLDGEMLF